MIPVMAVQNGDHRTPKICGRAGGRAGGAWKTRMPARSQVLRLDGRESAGELQKGLEIRECVQTPGTPLDLAAVRALENHQGRVNDVAAAAPFDAEPIDIRPPQVLSLLLESLLRQRHFAERDGFASGQGGRPLFHY